MADPTIPFGPDTEPLGLTVTDWEFISLDGPQSALDNEKKSLKKDGKFLRFVATREIVKYTANYIALTSTATAPARGLYDAAAGGMGAKVWIQSANISKPQEGDRTMAVTFVLPSDVAAPEALRTDLGLT